MTETKKQNKYHSRDSSSSACRRPVTPGWRTKSHQTYRRTPQPRSTNQHSNALVSMQPDTRSHVLPSPLDRPRRKQASRRKNLAQVAMDVKRGILRFSHGLESSNIKTNPAYTHKTGKVRSLGPSFTVPIHAAHRIASRLRPVEHVTARTTTCLGRVHGCPTGRGPQD